jgi:hypothetical protein
MHCGILPQIVNVRNAVANDHNGEGEDLPAGLSWASFAAQALLVRKK